MLLVVEYPNSDCSVVHMCYILINLCMIFTTGYSQQLFHSLDIASGLGGVTYTYHYILLFVGQPDILFYIACFGMY